jgi:aminopeptidase
MYDDMAIKMAELLTTYSQPINPGDIALIQGPLSSAPLMEALYEAILRRGGNPIINTNLPGLQELKLELANEEQLKFIDPATRAYMENVDILFNIFATDNSKSMATSDPKRIALAQSYQREITEMYFKRISEGTLRFCIFPWATNGSAQEAEMGMNAYKRFIYESCGFHLPDTLVYWQEMHDKQQEIVDFLNAKEHVHVQGPGGCIPKIWQSGKIGKKTKE